MQKFGTFRDKRDTSLRLVMDLETEVCKLQDNYMSTACKLAEETCLVRLRAKKLRVNIAHASGLET